MKPFQVGAIAVPITIRFNGKHIQFSQEVQAKIDAYWEELIASGKAYKRGEVFTVTEVKRSQELIEITVSKTDYAHYLYCQNIDTLGKYGIRIIHPAANLITKDNYLVFGEMGRQTARAGIYQLCGGGLDNESLKTDGSFDVDYSISQELQEELGVDIEDTQRIESFTQKYLKTGGSTGRMTVFYEVRLNETLSEFLEKYQQFEDELKAMGELPEFGKIVAFSLDDTKDLEAFLKDDAIKMDEYLRPFLEYLLSHQYDNQKMAG